MVKVRSKRLAPVHMRISLSEDAETPEAVLKRSGLALSKIVVLECGAGDRCNVNSNMAMMQESLFRLLTETRGVQMVVQKGDWSIPNDIVVARCISDASVLETLASRNVFPTWKDIRRDRRLPTEYKP